MTNEENDFVVEGEQLAYVGKDALTIPPELGQIYGPRIKRLDLSFNCLRNLDGIDGFSELQELILDGNEIDDNVTFPVLQHLHTLTMNKNKIQNLECLLEKITKCLPSLTYLSLLGNVACPNELSDLEKDEEDYQRYRYFVLHKLPNLKFLDSKSVSKTEKTEGLRRGGFLKVITPTQGAADDEDAATDNRLPPTGREQGYTPLPSHMPDAGDHHGTYGKSRYIYYGKHSEGNRFIRNSDL